jgi:hypothetical protein
LKLYQGGNQDALWLLRRAALYSAIQAAPVQLAGDISVGELDINRLIRGHHLDHFKGSYITWWSKDKKFIIKKIDTILNKYLIQGTKKHLSDYRDSLKPAAAATPASLPFEALGSYLDELARENPSAYVVASVYELINILTDKSVSLEKKLAAIGEFERQVQPWWQTLGKVLACIIIAAASIALGAAIGMGIVLAGAWAFGNGLTLTGLITLFTTATVSEITLGIAAGAGLSGVTAGTLSAWWLFKPTLEQRLAKQLIRDAQVVTAIPLPDKTATIDRAGNPIPILTR